MEIQYAFDPDNEFSKKLNSAFEATNDLTIPLGLMAREWFQGNKSIFKLKGPGRYKDLTDKYKSLKLRTIGQVYPILELSGALKDSITNPKDSESINLIVNKNTLVLGTKVPYAIYHQSNEDRTKMPYRPFLFVGVEQIAPNDIQQNRLKNWIKILESYVSQKLEK
jgi:phage gpG-like protein